MASFDLPVQLRKQNFFLSPPTPSARRPTPLWMTKLRGRLRLGGRLSKPHAVDHGDATAGYRDSVQVDNAHRRALADEKKLALNQTWTC